MALSLKFRRYRSRRPHLHTVTELRAEDNCTLWLRFDDGLEGHVYLGDLVEDMVRISNEGYAGSALTFVNYNYELPFFCDRVLPLMKQAGLRVV